jgi:membrane-bound serine protease (ClpP class)
MSMHYLSLLLILVAVVAFILLPWWVALPLCLPIVAIIVLAYTKGRQALRLPPTTGEESMIGGRAVVSSVSEDQIRVRYHGEIWRALSYQPLYEGQPVEIEAVQGLTVRVAPLSESADDEQPAG